MPGFLQTLPQEPFAFTDLGVISYYKSELGAQLYAESWGPLCESFNLGVCLEDSQYTLDLSLPYIWTYTVYVGEQFAFNRTTLMGN